VSKFDVVKQVVTSNRGEDLRDLEPDADSLGLSHWKADTSMDMRRKIAFAARLRTIGESWETVATILDYKGGQSARDTIVRDHAEEWDREQELAHVAVQRNYLPKKAIQGLLSAIDIFTTRKYEDMRGCSYSDAAKIAISAANAANSMLKTAERVGAGDVADDTTRENLSAIRKELNKKSG